jgi:hypothetical protein
MSNWKRKRWIGMAAVLVAFAILAAVFLPGEKEPEYQGKKLSEWVAMAQENPDPPEVDAAIIAIGTNNIPLLLRWLDYKPSKLREWVDDYSGDVPDKLKFLVRNRPDERADMAESTFQVLGMRAVAAIPELLRQAPQHDDGPDMRAFNCLGYMGEASFPAVARIVTNRNSPSRGEAVACIRSMTNLGTNTAPAVRLLSEFTRDSDRQIAEDAIRGLGDLRAEPDIALPALIARMHGSDAALEADAMWSICKFGTNARLAWAELTKALAHQNLNCRFRATNAVNAIAPEFFKTNGIEVRMVNPEGTFIGIRQVLTNNPYLPHQPATTPSFNGQPEKSVVGDDVRRL